MKYWGELKDNNPNLPKIAHREPLLSYIDKLTRMSIHPNWPDWYPMAHAFFEGCEESDLEVVASIHSDVFNMQDNDVYDQLNAIRKDETKIFFTWSQRQFGLRGFSDFYLTCTCPLRIMFVRTAWTYEFILKKSDLDTFLKEGTHGFRGGVASKKFNF